jgi:hypothetical protein
VTIDRADIEILLTEGESRTLDFKREQYKIVSAQGATDVTKGEFIKDVMSFANERSRRTAAHILIGVQASPREVVGLDRSLDDATLQEIVNSKTNAPVAFHYEELDLDGKTIGVLQIPVEQRRPIFMKQDYGKLRKNEAHERHGSRTRVLDPVELVTWGRDEANASRPSTVANVTISTPKGQQSESVSVVPIVTGGRIVISSDALTFLEERNIKPMNDEHRHALALLCPVRFHVTNAGGLTLKRPRLALKAAKASSAALFGSPPRDPRFWKNSEALTNDGSGLVVRTAADAWKVEVSFEDTAPKEALASSAIWVGAALPCVLKLEGQLFLDDAQPVEVLLEISIRPHTVVQEGRDFRLVPIEPTTS